MKNHISDTERIIKEFINKNGKFLTGTTEFDLRKELKKGENYIPSIIESLTSIIYGRYYAVANSAPLGVKNSNTPEFIAETAAFVKKLSEANQTQVRVDKGWIVETAYQNGQVKAKKGNSSQNLQKHEFEILNPGYPLTTGSLINRVMPKESTEVQPVFYYAYAEAGFDHIPLIMRFYWNIKPGHAAALIHAISKHLNHYRLPYMFKCLNHPAWYVRRDCAILYIAKRYHHILNEILPVIYEEVAGAMNDDIPMFTHQIAKGVGYADSPVNGDSFGMSRSRIIARGLVNGFRKDLKGKEKYFEEVSQQFSLENINPATPYIFIDSQKVITPFSAK